MSVRVFVPVATSLFALYLSAGTGCGAPEPDDGTPPNPTAMPTPDVTTTATLSPPTDTPAPSSTPPSPTPAPATPTDLPPTQAADNDQDGFNAEVDCNDEDVNIHPDGLEVCDGVDQDCDGTVDDAPEQNWYPDSDEDGYGAMAGEVFSGCEHAGYLLEGSDCDDSNPSIKPGAPENCDAVDENCDGYIDDHTACADDDGDGYCEGGCTDGTEPGDCNDGVAWTFPGAIERFDHQDNNCDGSPEDTREFRLDTAQLRIEGDLADTRLGWAVDGGGDVDGVADSRGYQADDLIVGAPGWDPEDLQRGAAYVISGRYVGWPIGEEVTVTDLPGVSRLTEEVVNAAAGSSVAQVGDVDGDGLDDFAVGAPRLDVYVGGQRLTRAGRVYLFAAGAFTPGGGPLTDALTTIDGTAAYVENGTSLAGGDVTGDGIPDLLMGAPHQSDSPAGAAGWVFVLPGRTTGWPFSAIPGDVFKILGEPGNGIGVSLAWTGVHDQNPPGIVAGGLYDSTDRGLSFRVPGGDDFKAGQAVSATEIDTGRWVGEVSPEQVGFSVAGGGDLSGDGWADLLIGRKLQQNQDFALVYGVTGGPDLTASEGNLEDVADLHFMGRTDDACPCRVSFLGDVNGDGLDDFVVGAAFASVTVPGGEGQADTVLSEAGRVYLLYGRTSPWPAAPVLEEEAAAIFTGEKARDRAGFYIAPAGDINGDGYRDLAVGAPFVDRGELNEAGRVYVVFGAP